jgi:hypothetical protein
MDEWKGVPEFFCWLLGYNNREMDKGSAKYEIINAYNQFDYKHQYAQLLAWRLKKLNIFLRTLYYVPTIIFVIAWLIWPSSSHIPNPYPGIILPALILIWESIRYLYILPNTFHNDIKSGMLPLLFCTDMPTSEFPNGLLLQKGCMPWGSIALCCLLSAGLVAEYSDSLQVGLFIWISVFSVYWLLIGTGLLAAFLPSYFYRTGLLVLCLFGVLVICTVVGALLPLYIWDLVIWIFHIGGDNTLPGPFLFIDFILVVVTIKLWQDLPMYAEMRRRGVFD